MKCTGILVVLNSWAVLAHDHHHHHHHHGHLRRLDDHYDESATDKDERDMRGAGKKWKRCGASEPTEDDQNAFARAQGFSQFTAAKTSGETTASSTRIIPVCFHVPQTRYKRTNDTGYITNEDLQLQLDHLNDAYSANSCCDTNFDWCQGECSTGNVYVRFVMGKMADNQIIGTADSASDQDACIKRPQGRQWMRMGANDETSRFIKSNLRVGDQRTLNVYLVRFFDPTLLGFATQPWTYVSDPLMDGVAVEPGSLRGYGYITGYNEGDTLVHEVGHWLGLFHTFQNGCNGVGSGVIGSNIVGDGIDDTTAEAVPYFGCDPRNRPDTCAGDSRPDPIFNFMDYSSDACMYQFTPGQAAAILNNIDLYRTPSNRYRQALAIQLQDSVPADPLTFLTQGTVQPYYINVPTNSTVSCTAIQKDGDVDLFMNWSGDWDNYVFDCRSVTTLSIESCEIGPASGVAYAFVHAYASSINVTVTCQLTSVYDIYEN